MGVEPAERQSVIRAALAIGLATGAYGLSFGALASATGLSIAQTCVLSLVMFTGASQFALIGVLGGGGSGPAAAAAAVLLGTRNALYGLRLSTLLEVRGWRRLLGAQLVIDESTAMAIGREEAAAGRLAFWATGVSVFLFWNLSTVLGALGAQAISDPRQLGLDAAAPAAFLALLAPRLRERVAYIAALGGAAVALAASPFVPAGVPVLLAALVAVALGARAPRIAEAAAPEAPPPEAPPPEAPPPEAVALEKVAPDLPAPAEAAPARPADPPPGSAPP